MDTIEEYSVLDSAPSDGGTPKSIWASDATLHNMAYFDIRTLIPKKSRVCIISPHPDDEILGCAGLIQQLDQLNYEIIIIAVTNGTASHPQSTIFTPEVLDNLRPQETLNALKKLKLKKEIAVFQLHLDDGKLDLEQQQLYFKSQLSRYLKPHDVLIPTFCKDGHPDHEITGLVTQQIAHDRELKCYQVLIWTWHWAKPNDPHIPWHHAYKLNLNTEQVENKRGAIGCFKSQIEADPSTGAKPIISSVAIDRILQPWEVYIDMSLI